MNKLKINKKILIPVIIIIVLIVSGIIAVNVLKNNELKGRNVIINNNNVTKRLKQGIIIEDDVIYMSMPDIKNFFDRYIYEDVENNQIITTSDKKVATLKYDSKIININGSEKQIYATIKKENDVIYLPISEMKDVYDIEISKIGKNNRIVIDSLDRAQKKVYAAKTIKIRATTKTFSLNLEKVKKGNWLYYFETDEKGWAKVRTEDGTVGYVKEKKLTNFVTVRDNMDDKSQIEGKVNLVWDYYSEYAKAPNRKNTAIEGINVVSPSFFYINNKGEFKENVGDQGKAYLEWAKENGYKVWPIVFNAGNNMMETTSEIMNNYEKRTELIEEIVNVCVKYKLDGINIDFENMKKDDADMFSRFIIELTPRIKEIGMVTSVDVTAPDGADNWSLCFDRNVIGHVADYIVFMAYDQYGSVSSKPGTTAGYNWIETNLNKFINTEEINSSKIILGVPLYTRMWADRNGKITSKVVDMNEIDEMLPNDIERKWDDTLKQYYVEYTDDEGTKRYMWIEDEKSIQEKISLVSKYNLGGVASWEKDRETENIWKIIKEELNK